MKLFSAPNQSCHEKTSGFALIVSLTLMGFLVLLAVGLFSMASVGLSVSKQTAAKTKAQANARMALMLAVGELQKSIGPDQSITASSDIRGTLETPVSKPHTVGVWSAWDYNPNTPLNYSAAKTDLFQRWLVSSANDAGVASLDFVDAGWSGEPTVELIGNGTLGPNGNDEDKVSAGLVPINGNEGSYAWHVSDESMKARLNLYRDPNIESDSEGNSYLAQRRALTSGHRPDVSVIESPDGTQLSFLPGDQTVEEFKEAKLIMSKVTGVEQAELIDSSASDLIKPLRHDVTLHSLGVMTNVRDGGLKMDLSSVFERWNPASQKAILPAAFSDKKIYETTHNLNALSDPSWDSLASYYNSFRQLSKPNTNPTYQIQTGTGSLVDPVPAEFAPAPVIARVDTIFSVVARPLDEMAGWLTGPNSAIQYFDFFLNMVYTPVVVLHNPYNVSVSFYQMDVSFENVPVGFNYMFENGESPGSFESRSINANIFECINSMVNNTRIREEGIWKDTRGDKSFTVKIANWIDENPLAWVDDGQGYVQYGNDDIEGPIVLKPGEALVCAPVLHPDRGYDQDTKEGHNAAGFDWDGRSFRTNYIKARPGFIAGLGYETNSVAIAANRQTGYVKAYKPGFYKHQAAIALRDLSYASTATKPQKKPVTDSFYIEYKIKRPDYYPDDAVSNPTKVDSQFTIRAKIKPTKDDELTDFAELVFDYGSDNDLTDIFDDRIYRYPSQGSYTPLEVAAAPDLLYSQQSSYVKPFAVFSVSTRTSHGGVYETFERTESTSSDPEANVLRDGRLAGKPFLYHNPTKPVFTFDISDKNTLSALPYELNFQPFYSNTDFFNYMDVDVTRVPALTGNTSFSGIKAGSYLEIPSGPLQSIADLARSNAFTTAYLPHFVQPVGNSLLHPLMSPDKVIESYPDIAEYDLLDHSFLLNHAFYDRYYFSTFATQDGLKPDRVFENFMTGNEPLASQAFQPYIPFGKTIDEAKTELYSSTVPSEEAYQLAPEYHMISGPFNVNSTSVEAWKSVLASLNNTNLPILWALNAELQGDVPPDANVVPIPSMSLHNAGSVSSTSFTSARIGGEYENQWNGYRELSLTELEVLAEKIVEEVIARGPFLSMSEFVNRRIGPQNEATLRGALEAAIAKAGINEPVNATRENAYMERVPISTSDVSDSDIYAYRTPAATTGNPAEGAPGWVSQADLMRILGPRATVRGDTFIIRVYGDTKNNGGEVAARAYAEAVVQRIPDYLDSSDRPSVNAVVDTSASATNKRFGRRLKLVSFRWLSQDEI